MKVHLLPEARALRTACGLSMTGLRPVRVHFVGSAHRQDVTCQDCLLSPEYAAAVRAELSEEPPLPDPRPAA